MCMYEECVWMGHIVPFLEKKEKVAYYIPDSEMRSKFSVQLWGPKDILFEGRCFSLSQDALSS